MGAGTFDRAAYADFATKTSSKTTDQIYGARSINKMLDPKGVTVRESRDSADSPTATPLIVALDVTGSMGALADVMARKGLGTLFNAILDRKPIPNPHVMFMAVGDANCDQAPLQVSQFEADNRIVEQLTQIYLEGGGGGNSFESYNLPWYFATYHTAHDSIEKRGKRGYLFTVGDEEVPVDLTRSQIERFIGNPPQVIPSTKELLENVQRFYDVYHIMVAEGSHMRGSRDRVEAGWFKLLGQRAIVLENHLALSETIVSIIEVAEGSTAADSAARWADLGTSRVVLDAIKNVPKGRVPLLGRPAA